MPKQIGGLTLYSIEDLREILGVQAVTLRRYLREGKIKARKVAGRWYVSEDALREFFLEEEEKVEKRRGAGRT